MRFSFETASCRPPAALLPPSRADSIIRDCEVVRNLLVPSTSFGGKWAVLGQSFGGFCATTYLSQAPEGRYPAGTGGKGRRRLG